MTRATKKSTHCDPIDAVSPPWRQLEEEWIAGRRSVSMIEVPTHTSPNNNAFREGTIKMSRNSEVNVKKFLEERLEAGRRINPENSDLFRRYAMVIDPYGILNDIPDEYKCIGKTWFVYSPDEGEVYVGDVPDKVIESIQKRTRGADLTYSEDPGF